jgi:DNA-binding NarL/FixJ family response regulator
VNTNAIAERTLERDHGDDETPDRWPIRVLVVDDHPAVRAGVRELLAAQPDIPTVTAVANARDAMSAARAQPFDVAIVDYHLPDRNGLALTRQLHTLPAPPRVLIYSAFADTSLAVAALVAGADGICDKSRADTDLCHAIRAVAGGVPVLPAMRPQAMRAITARMETDDLPILAMLVGRVAPEDIAHVLGISLGWLEARRWAILQRLTEHARSRGTHDAGAR